MSDSAAAAGRDCLLSLYRSMLRIRRFEEQVADLCEAGEIHTPCHLCIGQEAVAAGVCYPLRRSDTIWGAHRSHGHYLAKGGGMQPLMAEIFGRATGCSHGRGGSMHVCDPEVGVMGTVPIVAATIPIAVGAALAAKFQKSGNVAVSFFGDGATEEGHFFESLNLAAVQKLPVIFICENNLYSSHMSTFERRAIDAIPEFGTSQGVASEQVDGNNVVEVLRAMTTAIERARGGNGPTLLECRTFRWRGHVGPSWDEDVGVKRKVELTQWLEQDPIARCARDLEGLGISTSQLNDIASGIDHEVSAAVEFGRKSPEPSDSELAAHVYSMAGG